MTTSIVSETVEIWVSRDFDRYTHKVFRNSELASAQIIDAKRAAEIINANPDGATRGHEPVTFAPGAKQFTWIAVICEAADDR